MRQKNQIALVRAFSRLHSEFSQTILLIIGDGELRDSIASEIKSLDAESYFFQLGLKPNARGYCYVADAFVLPSLYEGMPMTLIEAMIAGLPVLATATGGRKPDMIEDGVTGYLCTPEEASIYCGLKRVMVDPDRQTIAQAGKRASERYTAVRMAEGYEELYTR